MVSKSSVLACFGCKPSYLSRLDSLPSPAPQQQVIEGRSFRQPLNHHKSKPETVLQDPSPSHEKYYLKSPYGEDCAAIVPLQQCRPFPRVEQKHSMAIAAATAVAAEAAVVAAQAAAEVARLSSGRHCVGGRSNEEWAALKIQGAFRGYLARRALRALKGLVRLQALFRGYSVRQKTISTLCSMQALARVQACMRSKRVLTGVDQASQSELLRKHQHSPWKKPAMQPETVVVGEGTKHQGWSWLDRENQKNKLRRSMESEVEIKGGFNVTKLRPGNVRKSPNWNDGHTRRAPLVEKSAKRTTGVNSSPVNPGLNKPHATSTNNYARSSSPCSFRTWDGHSYASGSSSTPNYMALTESARAKFCSRSSPKKSPVSPVQREYFYHLRDALHL